MAPLGKMKTKRSRTCIGCCYYTAQCIIRDVLELHDFWSKGGKLTACKYLAFFENPHYTKPRRSRTLCNTTTTTTQNVVPLKWIFLWRERERKFNLLLILPLFKQTKLASKGCCSFRGSTFWRLLWNWGTIDHCKVPGEKLVAKRFRKHPMMYLSFLTIAAASRTCVESEAPTRTSSSLWRLLRSWWRLPRPHFPHNILCVWVCIILLCMSIFTESRKTRIKL